MSDDTEYTHTQLNQTTREIVVLNNSIPNITKIFRFRAGQGQETCLDWRSLLCRYQGRRQVSTGGLWDVEIANYVDCNAKQAFNRRRGKGQETRLNWRLKISRRQVSTDYNSNDEIYRRQGSTDYGIKEAGDKARLATFAPSRFF